MGRGTFAGSVALVLLAMGAACGGDDLGPGIAASVGGREIAYREFEEYLERATGDASSLQSAALAGLFRDFLEEELLFSLALDRGLLGPDDRRSAAAPVLLEERGDLRPGEEDVQEYYRAHHARFEAPERVRLQQVLLQDREAAEAARRALDAGREWSEVVAGLENEHQAVVGPPVVLTRDETPEQLVEVVFALDAGEHSDVVDVDYGIHLFRVDERWAAGELSLQAVRPEIERLLIAERTEAALAELLEEARERYNVEVAEASLPFRIEA